MVVVSDPSGGPGANGTGLFNGRMSQTRHSGSGAMDNRCREGRFPRDEPHRLAIARHRAPDKWPELAVVTRARMEFISTAVSYTCALLVSSNYHILVCVKI